VNGAALPKIVRDLERRNLDVLPPGRLVAAAVQFVMMLAAQRNSEFVAYLLAQSLGLRKFEVVGVARCTLADHAGLGMRHQVKRIVVKPGGRLSLQKHHHRSEHWIVVHGTAQVTVNELVKIVHENESIYIPIGATHRLENPGKIGLELIEVQTGSYLGEDDIIRIEDDYRRS
jgi:mannose-6-phosphate isomerase-like protein (cupin superfamily)